MDDFNFCPTNTMALSSFDILKMNGVEDPLISIDKIANIDLEESYFESTLRFISEMNSEITDSKIELYRSIRESAGDSGVLLESFSDFFTKIKEIIDKFLKWIKSIFERFLTSLSKLVSSDKYITKHKDLLYKFKEVDNFDYVGYVFTINAGCPSPQLPENVTNIFGDITPENGNTITKDDIIKAMNAYEGKYNLFRGSVIGKDYKITEDEFSEELFKVFRNNSLDTETIEINSSKVNESLRNFNNYKSTKTKVETDRKNIDKEYTTLKDNINKLSKAGNTLDITAFNSMMQNGKTLDPTNATSLALELESYAKSKVDMVQQYSNIHALAFGAKLDALKARYVQDKNILYTAISKVQRTDSKRGE